MADGENHCGSVEDKAGQGPAPGRDSAAWKTTKVFGDHDRDAVPDPQEHRRQACRVNVRVDQVKRRLLVEVSGKGEYSPKGEARPTHWAFGQLSSEVGAPAQYLRTLPPPLAASCLAHGLASRETADWSLLVKNVPPELTHDLDYLVSMIDWDNNTKPNFKEDHYLEPRPVRSLEDMSAEGYIERWIVYRNPFVAAKELTVLPGRTVTIRDNGPYGLIVLQGHGTLGVWPIETPALLRFGQLSHDEYFISDQAAKAGVKITNPSTTDPVVMLKHFGPNHPDVPASV